MPWRIGRGRTAAHGQGGVERRVVGGDEGGEAVGSVRREGAVLAAGQLAAPLAQHAHLGGYRGRVALKGGKTRGVGATCSGNKQTNCSAGHRE